MKANPSVLEMMCRMLWQYFNPGELSRLFRLATGVQFVILRHGKTWDY